MSTGVIHNVTVVSVRHSSVRVVMRSTLSMIMIMIMTVVVTVTVIVTAVVGAISERAALHLNSSTMDFESIDFRDVVLPAPLRHQRVVGVQKHVRERRTPVSTVKVVVRPGSREEQIPAHGTEDFHS